MTDTISILTRGGLLEGELETWTHLLQLNIGDYGVFFLNSNEINENYTTFSGAQGFIRFQNNGIRGIEARDIVNRYNDVKIDVYDKIEKHSGVKLRVVKNKISADQNCVKVSILPIIPTQLSQNEAINFGLMLAMQESPKYLKSIKLRFRYNTDILGSNIINNNILKIELSANMPEGQYQLDVRDIQSNSVSISLRALGSSYFLLDQFYQQLLSLELNSSNLNSLSDFELIEQDFNENIQLIDPDNGVQESAECFETEIPTLSRVCPTIDSFSPKKVAAGVLGNSLNDVPGTISIRGSGFGDPNVGFIKPHLSDVCFYDPDMGYFEAAELEYLSWSDSLIILQVPTQDKGGGSFLGPGASTNRIKIFTTDFITNDTCTTFSQDSLYVQFGMFNDDYEQSFQNIEVALNLFNNITAYGGERRNLANRNGIGGYTVFVDSIYTSATEHDKALGHIISALDFYRCGYKFHFTDQSTIAANSIKRGSLPYGAPTTTFMRTNHSASNCSQAQADNAILAFEIVINESMLDSVWFPVPGANYLLRYKFNFNDAFQAKTTIIDSNNNETRIRDFGQSIMHEIGHVLQLRHTNNPNDLMAPSSIRTAPSRNPSSNDILGIEHSYLLSKKEACISPPMNDYPPCINSTHNLDSNVESLLIYPNPSNEKIQFFPIINIGNVLIYSLLGEVVWQNKFEDGMNGVSLALPKELSLGSYYIAIKSKSNEIVQIGKFIKL